MSWVYSEAGLSVFVYGIVGWLVVFGASKWVQTKPMEQRTWKDGAFVLGAFFVVLGGLGMTLGVDTRGWR